MMRKSITPILLSFLIFSLFSPVAQAFTLATDKPEPRTSVSREVIVAFNERATFELMEKTSFMSKGPASTGFFSRAENQSLNFHFKSSFVENIEPIFPSRYEAVKALYLNDLAVGSPKTLKEYELQIINEKRVQMGYEKLTQPTSSIATLSNAFKIKLQPFFAEKPFVKALQSYHQLEFAEVNGLMASSSVPNDPSYVNQWGLKNTGQIHNGTAGLIGADINIEPAWDITRGSASTIIAVLDSGVDPHVEFGSRLLAGKNFVSGADTNAQIDVSPNSFGHGTPVASIAAASGDNVEGVAGVCWNCKILPVRVIDSNGFGSFGSVAAGINYAAEYTDTPGAKIISLSFGSNGQTSTLMKNAVLNAEFFNVLVVASRGNYNNSDQTDPFLISEPAFRPETLSVGAMNPCGHRKEASSVCEGLSSWGSRYESSDNGGVQPSGALDLVAPGVEIYAAKKGGGYTSAFDGTSAAAPFVSGVGALLLSLDPTLTPTELRTILRNSAADLESVGWDGQTGYGKLDAYNAIQTLCEMKPTLTDCPVTETVTPIASWKLDETSWATANSVLDSAGTYHATAFGGATPVSSSEVATGNVGSFDGSDDYIKTPLTFDGSKSLAISAWYKTSNIGKKFMTVVGGINGGGFEVYVNNGKPGCRVWKNGEKSIYTTQPFVGDWHQIVCQRDVGAGQTKLYVDGVLQATTAFVADSAAGVWLIGRPGSLSATFYQGKIDQVSLYDTVLTDSDVSALFTQQNIYSSVAAVDMSLLGEWNFEESIWTSAKEQVIDSSVNNNNATALGGVTTQPVSGVSNTAALFDGVDDSVQTQIGYTSDTDITLSAWYKTDNSAKTRMTILGGTSGGPLELYVDKGKPACRVWDTADRMLYAPTTAVGQWTHVACVVRFGASPSTTLSVNGIEVATMARKPIAVGGAWSMGKPGSSSANYFKGFIDHPFVYGKALSASEVSALYSSTLSQYPFDSLDPDVLASYKFNDTSWTGLLGDVWDSVYKNHAQSQNGVFQTLKSAGDMSATFDGVNDQIATSIPFTSQSALSLSAWVKTTNITKKRMTVIGGNNGGPFEMYVDKGKPGCRVWSNQKEYSIFADAQIDSAWHHIVCSQDYTGGVTKLFVDGVLQKTVAKASISAGGSWFIGKPGSSLSSYFDGQIDNVKFYTKALSDVEVQALFIQG